MHQEGLLFKSNETGKKSLSSMLMRRGLPNVAVVHLLRANCKRDKEISELSMF